MVVRKPTYKKWWLDFQGIYKYNSVLLCGVLGGWGWAVGDERVLWGGGCQRNYVPGVFNMANTQ